MKTPSDPPAPRRKALGRGLDALLTKRRGVGDVAAPATAPAREDGDEVRKVPVDLIDPNPDQPRTVFEPDAIEELAQSIRNDGLIQPVLVRPSGSRYLLVVGERRLRAAKLAGLAKIPAIVRELGREKSLELALIENIQRENLNPIEVATALERMARELQLSHEELAKRTGKNRTTVTNLMRLLRLPADICDLVAREQLSSGHARALLALPKEEQQRTVAEKAVRQGLSVREVEKLVKRMIEPPEEKEQPPPDPNIAAAVEELERALGARVHLVARGAKKGRIEIEYSSQDELDRLYNLLTGES